MGSEAFELDTELAGLIERPMKLFTKRPAVAVETWRVAIIVLVIWPTRSRRRSWVQCLDTQHGKIIAEVWCDGKLQVSTAALYAKSRHDVAVHV